MMFSNESAFVCRRKNTHAYICVHVRWETESPSEHYWFILQGVFEEDTYVIILQRYQSYTPVILSSWSRWHPEFTLVNIIFRWVILIFTNKIGTRVWSYTRGCIGHIWFRAVRSFQDRDPGLQLLDQRLLSNVLIVNRRNPLRCSTDARVKNTIYKI